MASRILSCNREFRSRMHLKFRLIRSPKYLSGLRDEPLHRADIDSDCFEPAVTIIGGQVGFKAKLQRFFSGIEGRRVDDSLLHLREDAFESRLMLAIRHDISRQWTCNHQS